MLHLLLENFVSLLLQLPNLASDAIQCVPVPVRVVLAHEHFVVLSLPEIVDLLVNRHCLDLLL